MTPVRLTLQQNYDSTIIACSVVRDSAMHLVSSITSVRTGLKRPHTSPVEDVKFRRLRGLPLYCQRTTFRMFLGHSNKTVSHSRWSAITSGPTRTLVTGAPRIFILHDPERSSGAKTHSGIPPSFPLCFRMLNILGGLGALHAFHRIAAILTGG